MRGPPQYQHPVEVHVQEPLYQTIQEITQALKAITAELHTRHPVVQSGAGDKACREESCQALAQLEAQVYRFRRALGLPAFRS